MKDELNKTGTTSLSENFASSAQRVLSVDVERYQSYLDGLDVPSSLCVLSLRHARLPV
ncbi:MAG: hypothetical protein WBO29_08365 [Albidovulum sp.]